MSENKEDYEVFIHSKIDDTEIVTSSSEISKEWLLNSIASYDASNQKYSAYLKDGNSSSEKLTPEYIHELADGAQSDLKKILIINNAVRQEINEDGIVGKTVECITTNINTDYKLSYDKEISGRNKVNGINKFLRIMDCLMSTVQKLG